MGSKEFVQRSGGASGTEFRTQTDSSNVQKSLVTDFGRKPVTEGFGPNRSNAYGDVLADSIGGDDNVVYSVHVPHTGSGVKEFVFDADSIASQSCYIHDGFTWTNGLVTSLTVKDPESTGGDTDVIIVQAPAGGGGN